MVPECASSKRPRRCCTAPVKAPFSWPKSSEAISEGGMAAQLTLTNDLLRASRVPVDGARDQLLAGAGLAGYRDTVESVGATFVMLESTACSTGDEPTISSNMNA